MSKPTRFPNGVGTTKVGPLRDLGIPDPTAWITHFEDFTYQIGSATSEIYDENAVSVGAGTSTAGIVSLIGGALQITTAANDNDGLGLQRKHMSSSSSNESELFLFRDNKDFFFKARFKVAEATQSDFNIGVTIFNATPVIGPTSGAYFACVDGSTDLNFHVGNTALTSNTALHTMVDDTFVEVGFHYDGGKIVTAFVGNSQVARQDHSTTDTLPNLEGTDDMTYQILYLNGVAGALTDAMTIDYIYIAQER